MNNIYLSEKNIIKSIILNKFEALFCENKTNILADHSYRSLSKYSDKKNNYHVSFVKSKTKKFTSKEFTYRFKNLKYQQILNEALILESLNRASGGRKEVYFPKFEGLEDDKGKIIFRREYIDGVRISNLGQKEKLAIIEKCLTEIERVSLKLIKDNALFPYRSTFFIKTSFLAYITISILKDPVDLFSYIKLLFIFYRSSQTYKYSKNEYVLAHRDLHSDNILKTKKGNKIVIIDTEIATFSTPKTDLAIVARYYADEFDYKKLSQFVHKFIKNKTEANSFLVNAIFYTIQSIAMNERGGSDYLSSKKYSKLLLSTIIPDFI